MHTPTHYSCYLECRSDLQTSFQIHEWHIDEIAFTRQLEEQSKPRFPVLCNEARDVRIANVDDILHWLVGIG
jgi:hypothetical protein